MANYTMPSESSVREYWVDELNWALKGFDSEDEFLEPGTCFACGISSPYKSGCERAHIKAHQGGGKDTVENIHMLCRACHKVSETKEGAQYWKWFYGRTGSDSVNLSLLQLGNTSANSYVISRLFACFGTSEPIGQPDVYKK